MGTDLRPGEAFEVAWFTRTLGMLSREEGGNFIEEQYVTIGLPDRPDEHVRLECINAMRRRLTGAAEYLLPDPAGGPSTPETVAQTVLVTDGSEIIIGSTKLGTSMALHTLILNAWRGERSKGTS